MDDLLFNPFAEEDITSPLTPQSIPIDPPKEEFVTPETPAETVEPTLSLSDIAHLKTSLLSLKTQVDSMLDILKGHKAAPGSFSAISLGSIDFDLVAFHAEKTRACFWRDGSPAGRHTRAKRKCEKCNHKFFHL